VSSKNIQRICGPAILCYTNVINNIIIIIIIIIFNNINNKDDDDDDDDPTLQLLYHETSPVEEDIDT